MGGVATTDGGAGLVQALGAGWPTNQGGQLPPGGAALTRLAALDLSRLEALSGVEFWLASDVDNPLLGPAGRRPCTDRRKAPPRRGAAARALAGGRRAAASREPPPTGRARPRRPGGGRGGRARVRGPALARRPDAARHRAAARAGLVRRVAGRGAAGDHRRGVARRADAAGQGPGRCGPGRRRAHAAGPGGGGRGPVHAVAGRAPSVGHLGRVHRQRHRTRPGRRMANAGRWWSGWPSASPPTGCAERARNADILPPLLPHSSLPRGRTGSKCANVLR